MLDLQEYSTTNWASIVKSNKLLFDICGFETHNAPSVASYYDLLSRLWLSSLREHIKRKTKTRMFHPKPSKKLKANLKFPNKQNGIVKRLVNRLIKSGLPNPKTF